MRQGISREGVVLLPKDEFLLCNLPIINELSYFSIPKNAITKGNTMLLEMYQNAFQSGVPLDELTIDVDKLPTRNAQSAFIKLGQKNV